MARSNLARILFKRFVVCHVFLSCLCRPEEPTSGVVNIEYGKIKSDVLALPKKYVTNDQPCNKGGSVSELKRNTAITNKYTWTSCQQWII
mmetsp:Transcript_46468/g.55889  ORF Transcript_46468/g.55889 Transcript_46468/m.55889 type:complete len:90 (-) Transcript_46468:79-348(-)